MKRKRKKINITVEKNKILYTQKQEEIAENLLQKVSITSYWI